ncbi:uncharacterized protein LOC109599405 isoform X2 [Aethina tumida]|uniref:uncharacterized protein LOC109599405 isoform X2 n=1 Tax=Aethina tumida TaxID=116153 RepID=UPI0021475039|nr:uncharacterized protein LOC109599405 isoform X2 [Aethina tumida]
MKGIRFNMDKRRQIIQAIIISILVPASLCVEEPEPEVFLPPRNFNPHPYEAKTNLRDSGPVVFPNNQEDDNEARGRNNIVTIPRQTGHPVDNHPYPKVATKNRYTSRLAGKYHRKDNSVQPNVLRALSVHANKVLTRPVEYLRDEYEVVPAPIYKNGGYAFSYKVLDHLTGDDFSHRQSQNSKATKGEYRVKLPDGRVQIVSYTADKNGYKAEVKYQEDTVTNQVAQEPAVQIQKVPVRRLKPAQQLLDYFDIIQPVKPTPVVYVTDAPPVDADYSNYVTPQPGDILIPHTVVEKPKVQPKVQIITTNPRDYSQGSYIPVNVSPVYLQHPNVVSTTPSPLFESHNQYVSTTLSPLVINNGHHGHIVQKTQQDYAVHGDDVFLLTTVAPSTVAPKDILVNGERYTLLKNHISNLQFKKK